MRTILTLATICLFGLALYIGFCKPPTEQKNRASEALAEAHASQADIYAPNLFSQAQQQFNLGEGQIKEKDYSGSFQSYTCAFKLATQAKDAAQIAEAKKDTIS